MLKLIVAVDENWAIGKDNELLFHIKEDLMRFKNLTLGQNVVMGRKTLESMPKGAPLPKRNNIVLSRNELAQEVIHCRNMGELRELIPQLTGEIYIIGGENIYKQLLDFCAAAEVTKVQAQKQADAFFPNLDEAENWRLEEQSEVYNNGEVKYTFNRYINKKVRPLGELE